ncbi:hypothetical protein GIB67_012491 [Kingdonia uniflora]|uniref:RNA polymerase sigma-70 region 2 domain-containing protein n=1 Tax=Kingdonia uniflora TaxID=39325 RepID=A0A7J7MVX5_9MAGN|nr:hypothetical protein GIB67_012491 [Kingdonia uniflora]
MACILPQFKCPQDTLLCTLFRIHTHTNIQFKTRDSTCSRTQCTLSTTMATTMTKTTTTTVDLEKLRLPSLEDQLNSTADHIPFTYLGYIDPPTKVSLKAALASEALLTGEEAIIAAASAEAVALAKAAVEIAQDAASMVGSTSSARSNYMRVNFPSETDIIRLERARLAEMEQYTTIAHHSVSPEKESKIQVSVEADINLDPTEDKHMFQHLHISTSIDARSGRQSERRARRARAADKASSGIVSVNSGPSSRKKRSSLQDIDYNDPLYYLRGTTSTSRLLTHTEELELSEGIQDLLKLEKIHEELVERCGGEPAFSQWATVAGVDQKTLGKRISYGRFCKDKMVKSNIRLVISIAKNYQGAGMNLQDLVQEGCRGLVKGAEKFDASRGFKFSTYAHWWIKQAVRKSLSEQSRTIRLPVGSP